MDAALRPLAEIAVADSRFLAFCRLCEGRNEALRLQQSLKTAHPEAEHVPVVALLVGTGSDDEKAVLLVSEDGEPQDSVAPAVTAQIRNSNDFDYVRPDGNKTVLAVSVVRYFGRQLLGVSCGRLSQCYASVVRTALHRYVHGTATPYRFDMTANVPEQDLYGLAAGDCELVLNVVEENGPDTKFLLMARLVHELDFDGFRGAEGEVLPRLQNLQADRHNGSIPIYRYPGNYHGDEWETFPWSPTSRHVKKLVERRLQPLVSQTMNHCVANFYRNGNDFIDHHSDKDLDLNQEGFIVSVSLGDERILELKRRAEPRDITRITLPHGSMLVLGPRTNKLFTHAILAKLESSMPRLSLTLRDVRTFMDLKTGRLYGQGVRTKSVEQIQTLQLVENCTFFAGFSAATALLLSKRRRTALSDGLVGTIVCGSFIGGVYLYRRVLDELRKAIDEKAARRFFSKKSLSGTKY